MIGIGYCTNQNDKKIDDSNYINNMLMPGNNKFFILFSYYYRLTSILYLLGQENESWGCGYHGDDGYSFCSGSGELYDFLYDGNIPGYTTGDIVGCYLNFRSNIV